jgi:hypothetical protein
LQHRIAGLQAETVTKQLHCCDKDHALLDLQSSLIPAISPPLPDIADIFTVHNLLVFKVNIFSYFNLLE